MELEILIVWVLFPRLLLSLIPALWAQSKGHRFITYYLLAFLLFSPLITCIIVCFLKDETKTQRVNAERNGHSFCANFEIERNYCSVCGQKLIPECKYCSQCGSKIQ